MLQRHEDRDHDILVLRLIDVDAVFVMQGDHLLADHRDDAAVPVVQLEIERQNIAADLPPELLDVDDVLDEVQQLAGDLELRPVRHRDKMTIAQRKNLSLNIHTVDRPGQLMRISRCLEDLQLRVRGVKVKADEDEVDDSGEKSMYIDLEIFNKQSIKSIIIVDAVRQIDGVIRVDVV